MPRRAFDAIVSSVGVLLTAVLLIAGLLLLWGYNFANDNVTKELTAQKIFFPEADNPQLENEKIGPFISKYAGQQLVTGVQAEAYANHYIAVHLEDTAHGKTYAEMGPIVRANPDNTELAAQRDTLFKGETLRGLLLNAYAFWKLGQLALIGSIAAFTMAGLMALLSVLGFWHLRRARPEQQILAPVVATTSGETARSA